MKNVCITIQKVMETAKRYGFTKTHLDQIYVRTNFESKTLEICDKNGTVLAYSERNDKLVQQTNFERITASAEELAKWKAWLSRCDHCVFYENYVCKGNGINKTCQQGIAEWLRSEAK